MGGELYILGSAADYLDIKANDCFLQEFDPAFQGFNQGNFQIWAGQRTSKGTRVPPSNRLYLPPRHGPAGR